MALQFERLTNAERECLRLVHQGYGSKEIGVRRNVRSDRIDKIIREARAKLDNLPRREAARQFVEYEAGLVAHQTDDARQPSPLDQPTQNLGAQRLGVEKPGPSRSDDPTETPGGSKAAGRESSPRDTPWVRPPHSAVLSFPLGSSGSARNELDRFPRLLAIFIVAAAGALTAGATISLLYVLDHIAAGH